MVFAFFILRFVFLAALVHSYREVKESNLAEHSPRMFLFDAFDALARPIRAAHFNWPSEDAMIRWMEAGGIRDPLIRPADLHEVFGSFLSGAKDSEATPVDHFVDYLSSKAPEALMLIEVDTRFTRRTTTVAGPADNQNHRRSQAAPLPTPQLNRAQSRVSQARVSQSPVTALRRTTSIKRSSTAIPTGQALEGMVPLSRQTLTMDDGFEFGEVRGGKVKMNVRNVAQSVVHEITSQLAQSDLSEVNWLAMTGKVTTTLYREFTLHGLITHEPPQPSISPSLSAPSRLSRAPTLARAPTSASPRLRATSVSPRSPASPLS